MGVGAAQLRGLFIHQLDKIAAAGVVAAVKALLPVGGSHIALVPGSLGRGRGLLAGSGLRIVCGGAGLAAVRRGLGPVQLALGVQLIHILGQGQGRVVARRHHHQIEHVQAGEGLPHLKLRHRAACAGELGHHALGNGDLGVFNVGNGLVGHNITHDLGERRYGQLVVGVFAVNHCVRVQIEHEISLAIVAVGLLVLSVSQL